MEGSALLLFICIAIPLPQLFTWNIQEKLENIEMKEMTKKKTTH